MPLLDRVRARRAAESYSERIDRLNDIYQGQSVIESDDDVLLTVGDCIDILARARSAEELEALPLD
jgi:hypothetical protein